MAGADIIIINDKQKVTALSLSPFSSCASSDWNSAPDTQYHIQTDEGPERYFRYQTTSGQYRKEKRLEDGTVIGTFGWVDATGLLRMQDYIADNQGYRVLKTKDVFVGRDRPISQAVAAAKNAPANAGVLVKTDPRVVDVTPKVPYVQIHHNSIESSTETPSSTFEPPYYTPSTTQEYFPQSTPAPVTNDLDYTPDNDPYRFKYKNPYIYQNGPTYPIDRAGNTYNNFYTPPPTSTPNHLGDGYNPQYQFYDGVSVTNDGFRYYLPRQYHEEQNLPGDQKSGSFGYIDPFGIRRVIYYNAAPGTGFQHRKNNRYVGFNATPYDPRPYR